VIDPYRSPPDAVVALVVGGLCLSISVVTLTALTFSVLLMGMTEFATLGTLGAVLFAFLGAILGLYYEARVSTSYVNKWGLNG